jgi:hemerythrin-like domain-containing protein
MKKIANDMSLYQSEDMKDIVEFCHGYADEHHHMKEEKILFPEMLKCDYELFEGMINHVMLVEHDNGREHVRNMAALVNDYEEHKDERYLERLSFEMKAYCEVLKEHTEKEDECLYQFAENALSDNAKQRVDALSLEWESLNKERADHFVEVLHHIEKAY